MKQKEKLRTAAKIKTHYGYKNLETNFYKPIRTSPLNSYNNV